MVEADRADLPDWVRLLHSSSRRSTDSAAEFNAVQRLISSAHGGPALIEKY
jgi:hypothetical protein